MRPQAGGGRARLLLAIIIPLCAPEDGAQGLRLAGQVLYLGLEPNPLSLSISKQGFTKLPRLALNSL